VGLGPAVAAADVVLELAPRGIEGIVQCNMHVVRVIVIDHYVGARRRHAQAHDELAALVMVLVGPLDHDAAAGDGAVELLQLLGPGPDVLLERRRAVDAVERYDLKQVGHTLSA
jgi:hypothetical protein